MNILNIINYIDYIAINISWFYYTLFIFIVGCFGVFFSRKNVMILLMSLELLLLAININFICFSILLNDPLGELFALFLLTIGASESAIGLALIVSYYKNYQNFITFF